MDWWILRFKHSKLKPASVCNLLRQLFDAFASFPLVSLSARLPCLCGFPIQTPCFSAFCFDCLPPGLIQPHTTSETEIISWGAERRSGSRSSSSAGRRAKSMALF